MVVGMYERSLKAFLLSPWGAVLFALVMTLIVAAESLYVIWWSPFFIIYAALCIILPLFLGICRFGNIKEVFRTKLKAIILLGAVIILVDAAMSLLYSFILTLMGFSNASYFDLMAALSDLAAVAAVKFGTSSAITMVYIIVWAPIGEELFYRGYLFGSLREKGFPLALIVSSLFFGVRHATHFLFLLPFFPLAAATYWAVSTFIFGLLMTYYYERTQSLYPCMLIHFLDNIVLAFLP